MLLNNILKAFSKIGNNNGTAPPMSQDTGDAVLHEFYIADQLRSMAGKRRDRALAAVKELANPKDIEKCVKYSADNKIKNGVDLIQTEHYRLRLDTKAPALSLKAAKLTVALRLKGWTVEEVDKLIEDCSEHSKPAESYEVQING